MMQIKNLNIIHIVMMIYVKNTSVYAGFTEMNQCLYQLHFAFRGHNTLIECVKYAIEHYVVDQYIPVRNLYDPNIPDSAEIPENEDNYDINYAMSYYNTMLNMLDCGYMPFLSRFCSIYFPQSLEECYSQLVEQFGETPTQALRTAYLFYRLNQFAEGSFQHEYMKNILLTCHAYSHDRHHTGIGMKPTEFCLQFLPPDRLPL